MASDPVRAIPGRGQGEHYSDAVDRRGLHEICEPPRRLKAHAIYPFNAGFVRREVLPAASQHRAAIAGSAARALIGGRWRTTALWNATACAPGRVSPIDAFDNNPMP
jgi:hypothetical protein